MDKWVFRNQLKISVVILAAIVVYIAYILFGPKAEPPAFGQIQRPDLGSGLYLITKQIGVKLVSQRQVPKTLQVFKLKKPALSQQEAIKIAKAFGFTKAPVLKVPFRWKEGGRELEIQTDSFVITYKNAGIRKQEGKLSEKALRETAKKFLKKVGLADENLLVEKSIRYLAASAAHLGDVDNFKQADFVGVDFNWKIGDLFVFRESPTTTSATFVLNKKGQVFKLLYNGVALADSAVYPLKSLDEASSKIASEGVLVNNLATDESGFLSAEAFTKFTVEDYFLAYLGDTSSGFMQPIYVMRGRGSAGLFEEDIIIYVPALEDKWLK